MARNGTWLLAVALLAARAGAEDALLERWQKPKRETFEMPGAWPDRVVEALSERFGVPVELAPVDVKRADFVAKDATFFEALDAFARIHGLGVAVAVDHDGGELPGIRLVRAAGATAVAYLGPTRLSVESVTVVRVREFGAGGEEDVPLAAYGEAASPGLRLRLRWLAEPGLDAVRIMRWKVSAEDDSGKSLKRVSAGWANLDVDWETPISPNQEHQLAFAPPTRGAKTLRKVEGTATVAIPLERGKVEFTAADVGKTKPLGGARVKLLEIDAKGKTISFTFKGNPCPGVKGDVDVQVGSEDWHGFSAANPVKLLAYDAEGNEIPRGPGSEESSDWFGRRTWKIDVQGVPARIVFDALVRGEEREIPFSFADIPLPE